MDDTTPNRYLLHPDATEGIVYAFNTTDELGTKYYKAITAFLAGATRARTRIRQSRQLHRWQRGGRRGDLVQYGQR